MFLDCHCYALREPIFCYLGSFELNARSTPTPVLLHSSSSFYRRSSQKKLHNSRKRATERFTFDHSVISERGQGKLMVFSVSKIVFPYLSARHNLPDKSSLFLNNTQPKPPLHRTFLACRSLRSLIKNFTSHLLVNQSL